MSDAFDQAYREVELAYSQCRFAEALERAEQLLAKGSPKSSDPQTQRLKLLMGHSHFYGLEEPGKAAELYREVLESGSEPTYRELAAEGLSLCQQALQQRPPAAPVAPAVVETETAAAAPAMPWMAEPAAVLPAPVPLAVEPVRIQVLESQPLMTPPHESPPAFSPEEEAELAKGLLRVVLR